MSSKHKSISHPILVVEDDPVVRKFLTLSIGQTPQLEVISSVGSLREGATLLTQQHPEVMVVDLGLPDGSGIELVRQARRCQPPVECMVVTMYDDQAHLFAALEAGATGYLLKDALPDNIGHEVQKLLTGGSPISPAIARMMLSRFCCGGVAEQPEHNLTQREVEVLQLMEQGLLRKEVAHRLHISQHTINTHVRSIYRKLEVNTNTAAIRKAKRMDILPPDPLG